MQFTSLRAIRLAATFSCCLLVGAAALLCPAARAADTAPLWQIGLPDGNDAEFALAPDGYHQFHDDAFFVVGASEAKQDWPYVQPGPGDAWAGGRPHTFTVLFGLRSMPSPGTCRLAFKLLDTHYGAPPKLQIQVNGRRFEKSLSAGAGDESINGQPAKGRPCPFDITFPSDLLHAGDNDIQITTVSGSWLLYDWLGLETPAGAELGTVASRTVVANVQAVRALQEKDGQAMQPVLVTLRHFGDPQAMTVRAESAAPVALTLASGEQTVEIALPAVRQETTRQVTVEVGGQPMAVRNVTLKPVRPLTIYVLPHSHTDIGYTEIQTNIEKKQVNNLVEGIAAAKRTADYPAGARFVWNVEVLWAADLYLHRLDEQQRADFLAAVKNGQVGLNGMYLNELTGLCRPEELLQLFRYATELSALTGVPVDSAMISDVPGYTWGVVPAMAQAGIKYFSVAPNYFDRIGDILVQWENKPFWWTSPSGRERVLVWIPYMGYAMSHVINHFSPQFVDDYQDVLEKAHFNYDITYVRWSGHGDNAVPDPAICDFIKDWNAKYTWPKFVISRTSDAFRAFEQRYGDKLPVMHGDWTPYWEDGAGSSALETAMNRNSSDRLVQADALFAMLNPPAFPAADFQTAWRNTLLYSEHTWGADCSVSDPESQKTREQWAIKKSYADRADQQSRELVQTALASAPAANATPPAGAVDIFNTTSWTRTELVTLPKELSTAGDRVTDDAGKPVPSQRLTSGELVFVARHVPPFAALRFTVSAGAAFVAGQAATAGADSLDSGRVHLRLDPWTGGIVELVARGIQGNLADTTDGEALNDFLYLPGEDLKSLQRNSQVTITVKDRGPLVASLLVESAAPACNQLVRELRVVAGGDYVELLDTVDKTRAAISPRPGDWDFAQKGGKESINFAFPFRVPDGAVSLDIPLGWMRPELDQIPGACKNWLTVGRWADVSNRDHGVTLVMLDTPLVQVGGITAHLTGSQHNPDLWRKHIGRTQRLYVWAMNNHWETNYRAYQDGRVTFRFVLRPHRKFLPADATRFSTAFSQPLIAAAAHGAPMRKPLLRLEPADVVVTTLKPSDDGHAWIVRLFGASGRDAKARLIWSGAAPKQVGFSNTGEKPLSPAGNKVIVPGWDVVTLRAER
jgi:hypothetical protein